MAEKNPGQQIASKALEATGPQGQAVSFFIQNWKQILLAILIWVLVVIVFSAFSIFIICSCIAGTLEAGLIRGYGIYSTSAGKISSQPTTDQNSSSGEGTEFDEDCFVKLVRQANPNVTEQTAKQYKSDIQLAANSVGINAAAVAAVAEKESTWINHNCSGDELSRGIMQIQTRYKEVCSWGIYEVWKDEAIPFARKYGQTISDIMNERHSFIGGAAILKENLNTFNGDYYKAFAAYNGGPGCVRGNSVICPQAREYANSVSEKYQKFRQCLQSTQSTQGSIKCNVVYINQNQQGLPSGCGPTSLAMIFQTYGKNISPHDIIKTGTQTCNNCGMKGPGEVIPRIKDLSNLNWTSASTWNEIENQVRSGNPVAVGTGFSGSSGHWIVIVGFDSKGNIIANDPAGDHGKYYTGGYVSNNGKNVVYDREDFHKHFDQDPRYPGGIVFNIYVKNPPNKINCE